MSSVAAANERSEPEGVFVTSAQVERARDDGSSPRALIRRNLLRVCSRRHLAASTEDLFAMKKGLNLWAWDVFLQDLAVAHHITGDEEYLAHTLPFLREVPARWQTVERDRDLFVPVFMSAVLGFIDLERDHLPAAELEAASEMVTGMAEWLFGQLPVTDYGERGRAPWNHSIMAFAAIGNAGLFLSDHADAADWLETGLERTRYFFDVGLTDAGMTYEGLHYNGYVFRLVGQLLNGMRNAGRIDEVVPVGSAAEQKLRRVPAWFAHETWPRGQFLQNYGDSHWKPHSPVLGFLRTYAHYEPELCAAVWNRLVGVGGDRSFGWKPRWSSISDSLLFYPDVDPDNDAIGRLPLSFHCPEFGYVSARDSWREDASVFTFNCGSVPCELHDQSDNNSYTFHAGGDPIVIDAGAANRCIEGSASSSHGHNLVFIDGVSEHPAGQGTYLAGRMLGFEDRGDHVVVAGDATDSYGHEGFNTVRRAIRHAIFVREPVPYLIVFDDIDKDGKRHEYEYRLHSPYVSEDSARDDASFVVRTEEGAAAGRIQVLNPTTVRLTAGAYTTTNGPFETHALWSATCTSKDPRFVVLHSDAHDGAGAPMHAEVLTSDSRVIVRLQWHYGRDEITFSGVGDRSGPTLPILERGGAS